MPIQKLSPQNGWNITLAGLELAIVVKRHLIGRYVESLEYYEC